MCRGRRSFEGPTRAAPSLSGVGGDADGSALREQDRVAPAMMRRIAMTPAAERLTGGVGRPASTGCQGGGPTSRLGRPGGRRPSCPNGPSELPGCGFRGLGCPWTSLGSVLGGAGMSRDIPSVPSRERRDVRGRLQASPGASATRKFAPKSSDLGDGEAPTTSGGPSAVPFGTSDDLSALCSRKLWDVLGPGEVLTSEACDLALALQARRAEPSPAPVTSLGSINEGLGGRGLRGSRFAENARLTNLI